MKTKFIAVAFGLVTLWVAAAVASSFETVTPIPTHPAGTPVPDEDFPFTSTGVEYDSSLYEGIATELKATFHRACPDKACRSAGTQRLLKLLRLQDYFADTPAFNEDYSIDEFVDRAATCASHNPYLNNFIATVANKKFWEDKKDYDEVLVRGLQYAVFLDRITTIITTDYKHIEPLLEVFNTALEKTNWREYTNLFERAKKATINNSVKTYVGFHEKEEVNPIWGRHSLPLNILEACMEDFRLGNPDNAKAGLYMAFLPPGQLNHDEATGAGPSRFDEDGHILYTPPLPKQWADLYSTWNMAFVSHYPNNVEFWAKLVTPRVLCYDDNASRYLYNRAIALWIHIQFEMFSRVDRQSADPDFHWDIKELTSLWSAENLNSAHHYAASVRAAKPSLVVHLADMVSHEYDLLKHITNKTIGKFLDYTKTIAEKIDTLSFSGIVDSVKGKGQEMYDLVSDLFSGWF